MATSSTVCFAAINGYVTVLYDGFRWLASVIKSMQETDEVKWIAPSWPMKVIQLSIYSWLTSLHALVIMTLDEVVEPYNSNRADMYIF